MSTSIPQKVRGADVSHHQGTLDLVKAEKAGLEWLCHKATEGTTVTDSEYKGRRAQAKEAGLPFGAYHFARPSRGDAVAEARRFLDVAKPRPGDVAPVLDIETAEGMKVSEIDDWSLEFCKEVRKQAGRVGLYTPYLLPKTQEFVDWVWRPRYNRGNVLSGVLADPAWDWDVWQFSNGVWGVPDEFPGLGHVDLNTHRKGFVTRKMLIPDPPKPTRKTRRLRMAVAPMQHGDSDKQTRSDFAAIFAENLDVVFGTEVGPGSSSDDILKEEAKRAGYLLASRSRYDTWVAVKSSLIVPGTWETGAEHAIDRSSRHEPTPPGRWGDKAIVWGKGEIEGLGVCAFGSVHPLTHRGAGKDLKALTDDEHAEVCAAWVAEHGKGRALAFLGGDWNLNDRRNDLTQGKWEGVSCWDETQDWENTGHGNIDAILRSVADTRVTKFVSAKALDDKDLHLFTDHFLTVVVVEIEDLP